MFAIIQRITSKKIIPDALCEPFQTKFLILFSEFVFEQERRDFAIALYEFFRLLDNYLEIHDPKEGSEMILYLEAIFKKEADIELDNIIVESPSAMAIINRCRFLVQDNRDFPNIKDYLLWALHFQEIELIFRENQIKQNWDEQQQEVILQYIRIGAVLPFQVLAAYFILGSKIDSTKSSFQAVLKLAFCMQLGDDIVDRFEDRNNGQNRIFVNEEDIPQLLLKNLKEAFSSAISLHRIAPFNPFLVKVVAGGSFLKVLTDTGTAYLRILRQYQKK